MAALPAGVPAGPVVDEVRSDGAGWTRTTMVTVVSPSGAVVPLVVRWVEAAGHPPVLVLAELPGQSFWWGVPEALVQAVEAALVLLDLPADRRSAALVLGQRPLDPAGTGSFELAAVPLGLRGGVHLLPGRQLRPLVPEEQTATVATWRLAPVTDLLGVLDRSRVPTA